MDFTALGLPQSFHLFGWLGLAVWGWRWIQSGDWHQLGGAYPLDYLLSHYTPYAALLISWAEAFSTGMAITVMAVYRPAWLETFDDVKYLQNK